MNIYFTSDTHWGHTNVIRYSNRPYASTEEMNEALIANWNSRVKPGDSIYHLGDFAFMTEEQADRVLQRLNGQKYFIYGNHDKVIKRSEKLRKHFVWCRDYAELYLTPQGGEKVPVILSHFPMITWNKAHHGSIMLHGHCHGNLKYPFEAKIMDVGVDPQGYFPISAGEVLKRMSNVSKQTVDHHTGD